MWKAFEEVSGLAAIPAVWRKHLGERFPAVAGVFMRRHEQPATAVFCKRCYCSHRVVPWRDRFLGICDCEYQCDDIELTAKDLEVWEVNQKRLGRAVVSALGCDEAEADLGMPSTRQVGAFGAERLPVVLAMVQSPDELRAVSMELAARLRDGFALLTPTGRFVDARVKEVLAMARASFMSLADQVEVGTDGELTCEKLRFEMLVGEKRKAETLKAEMGTNAMPVAAVTQCLRDIREEIAAVRTDYHELRRAKERLEKMRAEGFTERIDPASFRLFCAVLAHGDVAKASRALNEKDSTVRSRIEEWKSRGPAYKVLVDLVRWRKAVGRRDPAQLSEDILGGKAASADYAGLISDVIEELLEFDEENWAEKCQELTALLRNYSLQ